MSEKFEELEAQVDKWIGLKEKREQELKNALDEAQKGLDEASADSEKYMKAGDLKKYTEAETRKGYFNKRINLFTNQTNDLLENGYLSKDSFKSIVSDINTEQNRLLQEQRKRLEELANEVEQVVNETTMQIRKGSYILSLVSTQLLDDGHEYNPYLGMDNNNAENIAENFWYSLRMSSTVPHHSNNPRYSKFVAGVPFVDDIQ